MEDLNAKYKCIYNSKKNLSTKSVSAKQHFFMIQNVHMYIVYIQVQRIRYIYLNSRRYLAMILASIVDIKNT